MSAARAFKKYAKKLLPSKLDFHMPSDIIGVRLEGEAGEQFDQIKFHINTFLQSTSMNEVFLIKVTDAFNHIREVNIVESRFMPILKEVVYYLRLQLLSSNPTVYHRTMILLDALIKNCDYVAHALINKKRIMSTVSLTVRRNRVKTNQGFQEASAFALDCIQGWGEAFLRRRHLYPNYYDEYVKLKTKYRIRFHRPDNDPTRVPIFLGAETKREGDFAAYMSHHDSSDSYGDHGGEEVEEYDEEPHQPQSYRRDYNRQVSHNYQSQTVPNRSNQKDTRTNDQYRETKRQDSRPEMLQIDNKPYIPAPPSPNLIDFDTSSRALVPLDYFSSGSKERQDQDEGDSYTELKRTHDRNVALRLENQRAQSGHGSPSLHHNHTLQRSLHSNSSVNANGSPFRSRTLLNADRNARSSPDMRSDMQQQRSMFGKTKAHSFSTADPNEDMLKFDVNDYLEPPKAPVIRQPSILIVEEVPLTNQPEGNSGVKIGGVDLDSLYNNTYTRPTTHKLQQTDQRVPWNRSDNPNAVSSENLLQAQMREAQQLQYMQHYQQNQNLHYQNHAYYGNNNSFNNPYNNSHPVHYNNGLMPGISSRTMQHAPMSMNQQQLTTMSMALVPFQQPPPHEMKPINNMFTLGQEVESLMQDSLKQAQQEPKLHSSSQDSACV